MCACQCARAWVLVCMQMAFPCAARMDTDQGMHAMNGNPPSYAAYTQEMLDGLGLQVTQPDTLDSNVVRIETSRYRLGVAVGDAAVGGITAVTELYINQDGFPGSDGFGWSANLLYNYTQHTNNNAGRLSGTGIVTVNATGQTQWHAPIGGKVMGPATHAGQGQPHDSGRGPYAPTLTALQSSIQITGIALGTVATETWNITLAGDGLHWGITRTFTNTRHDSSLPAGSAGAAGSADGTAVHVVCDRAPTLVFNAEYTTTGHVLKRSAQIPSFLDAGLKWDPESGTGFVCDVGGVPVHTSGGSPQPSPGKWTLAYTQRTTQEVALSPSSLAWASSSTLRTINPTHSHGMRATAEALESPLFVLSYPTFPGTGGGDTTMALGVSTITPPSRPPVPSANVGGAWGMYIISPDAAQWYVPPSPLNTTKHHIQAAECGTTCPNTRMPATCTGSVPVSQAEADTFTTGAAFSCGVVPATNGTKTLFANAVAVAPGTEQHIVWSLQLHQGAGIAPGNFHLSTPDKDLNYNMKMFAQVYNMFAGNIFGNSPASIVCLHEMSWFPQIQSVFTAGTAQHTSVHAALASELEQFAKFAVQPNGFVYARWNQGAYINMTIHDQMPHFILAYYYHVINTGDVGFLSRVWPALNHAMEYVLVNMKMEAEGVATTPTAHGMPHEDHADNWLDIVNFGGKDAIINSYLVTALKARKIPAAAPCGPILPRSQRKIPY